MTRIPWSENVLALLLEELHIKELGERMTGLIRALIPVHDNRGIRKSNEIKLK